MYDDIVYTHTYEYRYRLLKQYGEHLIALCLEMDLLPIRLAALKDWIGLLDSYFPGSKLWRGFQRQNRQHIWKSTVSLQSR